MQLFVHKPKKKQLRPQINTDRLSVDPRQYSPLLSAGLSANELRRLIKRQIREFPQQSLVKGIGVTS
jgi:hypothetical protein